MIQFLSALFFFLFEICFNINFLIAMHETIPNSKANKCMNLKMNWIKFKGNVQILFKILLV